MELLGATYPADPELCLRVNKLEQSYKFWKSLMLSGSGLFQNTSHQRREESNPLLKLTEFLIQKATFLPIKERSIPLEHLFLNKPQTEIIHSTEPPAWRLKLSEQREAQQELQQVPAVSHTTTQSWEEQWRKNRLSPILGP